MNADQLSAVIDRYLTNLRTEGIRSALYEDFTLWTVLADLYTHAGIERDAWHPAVQAADELTLWCEPTPAA